MSIKRLGSNSGFSDDALLLLENYGLAVYAAQLFERDLQVIITGLERLGAITLPPDTDRSSDGFVETCLGPMLRVLENQGTMDREMSRLFKKAQYDRNHLIHRFIAENIVDMLNESGCAAVNDKLQHIFTTVCRAQSVASQLRDQVWAQLGIPRAEIDRQIEELQRLANPTADDFTE